MINNIRSIIIIFVITQNLIIFCKSWKSEANLIEVIDPHNRQPANHASYRR